LLSQWFATIIGGVLGESLGMEGRLMMGGRHQLVFMVKWKHLCYSGRSSWKMPLQLMYRIYILLIVMTQRRWTLSVG
jgi:hypothetical protein